MKKRIYLRIAKTKNGRVIVRASTKVSYEALKTGFTTYHPTVMVALDIEIPDNEFDVARILLEAKIKETTPAVKITQIEMSEEVLKK